MRKPTLAIIIPCFNEELLIESTVSSLFEVINSLIEKGKILEEKSANSRVLIEIKNKLSVGDTLELIIPNEIKPQAFAIEKLYDSETNEEISTVNPGKQGQTVILEIPFEVKKGWILRRKK